MARFEFIERLLVWLLETSDFEFEWDRGNQTKSSTKHAVTTTEVQEVFLSGRAAPLGIVVFTMRKGKVRPISARPAKRRSERFMKRTYYAKSEKEYEAASQFDRKKILEAAARLKKSRKLPTSVALEESTITELKALARWRGVPYQVLMRMFILDGLRKSLPTVNF